MTVTDRRIEAVRYCSQCKREVAVTLEIRPDTIRVECGEWHSYELPRFAPDGSTAPVPG